ncbi:Alpha/Beta hydrolase protein, partial [Piptocephalis cylindrospora]
VALILHGMLGHKDYLYQKTLAHALPIPSIRFDFGGNGDSGDRFIRSHLKDDITDVESVATWARNTGFQVSGVIGHSRGGGVAINWAIQHRPRDLQWIVDLSGRYYLGPEASLINTDEINQALQNKGYHDRVYTARGRKVITRLTQADVAEFKTLPTSMDGLLQPFPYELLILHGSKDAIVDVKDSRRYHEVVPGSTLKVFPEVDHNFTGNKSQVVQTILTWLDQKSFLPAPQANL